MNSKLTYEICRHILFNFGVDSSAIDKSLFKSILDKEFLLKDKINLEFESEIISNRIWGCQQSVGARMFTILIADLSIGNDIAFSLIVQMQDAPAYGVYVANLDEANISCIINDEDWMKCNIHLQATFLAAMEQIKEVGLSWRKASDYDSQLKLMKSFIRHNDSLYGDQDEGQED